MLSFILYVLVLSLLYILGMFLFIGVFYLCNTKKLPHQIQLHGAGYINNGPIDVTIKDIAAMVPNDIMVRLCFYLFVETTC